MKKLFILIAFFLVLSTSASAQTGFFGFNTGSFFGNNNSTVLSTPLINQSSFTFYDQLQDHFIVVRNINNPAFLRISILNLNYKVVKTFKPPSTSSKRAFGIRDLSFYPTEVSPDHKTKPGMLIIETDRGNIIINLVTLKADFLDFQNSFFESPKNTEIEFIELTEPSFL